MSVDKLFKLLRLFLQYENLALIITTATVRTFGVKLYIFECLL